MPSTGGGERRRKPHHSTRKKSNHHHHEHHAVALLHSNSTFDLPTSIRVLVRGDFFYFLRHNFKERNLFMLHNQFSYNRPCKAEPHFLWLDTRSYLLVWSDHPPRDIALEHLDRQSRSTLFCSRLKLEEIYQISCRSFVMDAHRAAAPHGGGHRGSLRGAAEGSRMGMGTTYYVIGIQSTSEVVELTTVSQSKADTWYDALHNVCEFVRRTGKERRPDIPD